MIKLIFTHNHITEIKKNKDVEILRLISHLDLIIYILLSAFDLLYSINIYMYTRAHTRQHTEKTSAPIKSLLR